jgi:hypothetical protein
MGDATKCLVVHRKNCLEPVVFRAREGETLDEWELEDFKDCQLVRVGVFFKKEEGGRRRDEQFFAADEVSHVAETDDRLYGEVVRVPLDVWRKATEKFRGARPSPMDLEVIATMILEWGRR